VYSRQQVKNQLVILKNIHSFWRYLQVHTGLGRNPDGTLMQSLTFGKHTQRYNVPYLIVYCSIIS